MFLIYALLIMVSVYVAKHGQIEENMKTGYFIFVAIIVIISIVFTIF